MDYEQQNIYFSRDIVFYEHVFPYASSGTRPLFLPVSSSSCEEPSLFPDSVHAPAEPSQSEASEPVSELHPSPQHLRKPSRIHKSLSCLQDYVVHSTYKEPLCFATLINLSIQPPMFPVHYLHSSSQQLLERLNFTEPQSYDEAVLHHCWQVAMT